MFTSSVAFELAEYLRIPVTVDPTLSRHLPAHVGALHATAAPNGPRLLWARAAKGGHARKAWSGVVKFIRGETRSP